MTFQYLNELSERSNRRNRASLISWIAILTIAAAPVSANMFGAVPMDKLGRLTGATADHTDCDALRRDNRLRNLLKPSERRAMIRSCKARAQEILIVSNPPVSLEDPSEP
jgi:hypothetical protein